MKTTIEAAKGLSPEAIPESAKAELARLAVAARERSHCPYSHTAVGAALLCADGTVYTGANIENAAFSPSVCAERVALFTAVHDGRREFLAIAVAGGEAGKPPTGIFPPCGVCRQVMAEFFRPDARVLLADGKGYAERTFADLLPDGFGPGFLL